MPTANQIVAEMRRNLRARKREKREAAPHATWTKDQLWTRIVELEQRLTLARNGLLNAARDAHNDGRHEQRDDLRRIADATEFRPAAMGAR